MDQRGRLRENEIREVDKLPPGERSDRDSLGKQGEWLDRQMAHKQFR